MCTKLLRHYPTSIKDPPSGGFFYSYIFRKLLLMKLEQKVLHGFYKLRNTTLSWTKSDNERRFKENLRNFPDDENLLYYRDNPIQYKLNNYGFRTDIDFKKGTEGNVFLGCSHTFGSGHHIENVWSYKVNKEIGGNFLNLGAPGTGIGTSSRLLHYFKDMLKVKNIFLFNFHPYRYEYFDPIAEEWLTISPTFDWLAKPRSTRMYLTKDLQKVLLEDNNMEMYYNLHFSKIVNLADYMGAQLFTVTPLSKQQYYHINVNKSKTVGIPSKARDNHMPISHHNEYTKIALNCYKKKIKPDSTPQTFQLSEEPSKIFGYNII